MIEQLLTWLKAVSIVVSLRDRFFIKRPEINIRVHRPVRDSGEEASELCLVLECFGTDRLWCFNKLAVESCRLAPFGEYVPSGALGGMGLYDLWVPSKPDDWKYQIMPVDWVLRPNETKTFEAWIQPMDDIETVRLALSCSNRPQNVFSRNKISLSSKRLHDNS